MKADEIMKNKLSKGFVFVLFAGAFIVVGTFLFMNSDGPAQISAGT